MVSFKWSILLVIGCLLSGCTSSVLDDGDKARLRNVVALQQPLDSNDLSAIYYYVNLNQNLGKAVPEATKICGHIQAVSGDDLDSLYFVTSIAQSLGSSCQLPATLVTSLTTKLQAAIKEGASVAQLNKAGLALANLNKPLDSAKVSKLLLTAIKKDDTLLNTGLAFQLASKFTKQEDRQVFLNKVGEVIVQADEINEKILQFEGGLGVTHAIVTGIYRLSTAANKPIALTKVRSQFLYFLCLLFFILSGPSGQICQLLFVSKVRSHTERSV